MLDLVSASTIDGITLVSSTAVVPWLHGMRPVNGQAGGVLVGATAAPIQGNALAAIVGNDRAAIIGRTPGTIIGGPS